jgi:hypothetical protein
MPPADDSCGIGGGGYISVIDSRLLLHTCVSYEEEDTWVSYEEEDTWVSYEEEEPTCVI